MELKSKISEIRNKLNKLGSMERNKDLFLAAIQKFMDLDHLTAPLLRELIDRIEVHETEGTGKHRTATTNSLATSTFRNAVTSTLPKPVRVLQSHI